MNLFSQSHFERPSAEIENAQVHAGGVSSYFDVLGALRRQMWIVGGAASMGALIGLLYVMQLPSVYSSSSSILIDAKNVGMAATSALEGTLAFETGAVDSQLQILQSDKLAAQVVQRLGLQNNLNFLTPPPSHFGAIAQTLRGAVDSSIRIVTGGEEPPPVESLPESLRILVASSKLQNNLKVIRVAKTYVFSIEFTDRDPALAQSVTGQYVNAYLEDQLDSKFESTRRATNWMEDRIRELRSRSLAADQAVQQYRADNNLIEASGRLIDEQSLTDATTQLATARLALDSASAKYQRLREIVDKQDATGSLTESAGNPNVAQLRAKYLESAKLYSDMRSRYGESHSVAVKASKDMVEYQRLIFEELKNLLPGYQSDVSIAQSRVNSIQSTINDLRIQSVANESAMVKLRGLEQESDTLKLLYSTFLQKSQEMQQQQSFPVTDARIISDPSTPILPSGPRKIIFLLGFLIMGAASGVGLGALREWRDRGIRTPLQVREELGLEFLANIPFIKNKVGLKPTIKTGIGGAPLLAKRPSNTPDVKMLREVVDQPLSQFSEAIRALRIKVDQTLVRNKTIVIGVASMYPDEGKSTIAKSLASSLAFQGTKTILIDGDLRNPSLTRSLSGASRSGLVDVIDGRVQLSDVVSIEDGSNLVFLPGATRAQQGSDLFSTPKAQMFISGLRQQFDVIVIDFPPVAALSDAYAAISVVDGYVFVAQWGRTSRKSLREFFDTSPRFAEKTLGIALNKVDMQRLERYGSTLGGAHYGKYAERYFPKV